MPCQSLVQRRPEHLSARYVSVCLSVGVVCVCVCPTARSLSVSDLTVCLSVSPNHWIGLDWMSVWFSFFDAVNDVWSLWIKNFECTVENGKSIKLPATDPIKLVAWNPPKSASGASTGAAAAARGGRLAAPSFASSSSSSSAAAAAAGTTATSTTGAASAAASGRAASRKKKS